MDYETLLVDRDPDGVMTLTINRPDRYNAFSERMQDEFVDVWESVRSDDDVRCVILTAAGEKAFSTGIDRDEVPADDESFDFSPFTYRDPGDKLGPKSNECWTPVIAAVNGMACGGAFYLLGEADFIIAADHATFFDPHVTYGMPAVYEPIQMMARMPVTEVLRMTLLGNHERMSATRAHQIGLVSEVVPGGELMDAARWAAQAIASQPAAAVQASVRSIWAAQELTRQQAIDLGPTFLHLGVTPEGLAEGQAAFASGQRIKPRTR